MYEIKNDLFFITNTFPLETNCYLVSAIYKQNLRLVRKKVAAI